MDSSPTFAIDIVAALIPHRKLCQRRRGRRSGVET